jgi:type 1 glutamine amidotransferase
MKAILAINDRIHHTMPKSQHIPASLGKGDPVRRLRSIPMSLVACVLLGLVGALSSGAVEAATDKDRSNSRVIAPLEPIRALFVGHEHAEVTPEMLVAIFTEENEVMFDIRTDWQNVLRRRDFAEGYDVIVYCPCDPENRDMELVNHALEATRSGKGTVLLHCAMHTFRHVPTWTELLGVRTITHDGYRELTIKRATNNHPILVGMPESWITPGDELYAHEYVVEGVTPLLTAYSVETRSDHVVAWAHSYGEGRVFGTSLGHDRKTIETEPYKKLLGRGLAWAASREHPDVAPNTVKQTNSEHQK